MPDIIYRFKTNNNLQEAVDAIVYFNPNDTEDANNLYAKKYLAKWLRGLIKSHKTAVAEKTATDAVSVADDIIEVV